MQEFLLYKVCEGQLSYNFANRFFSRILLYEKKVIKTAVLLLMSGIGFFGR